MCKDTRRACTTLQLAGSRLLVPYRPLAQAHPHAGRRTRSPEQGGIHRSDSKSTVRQPHSQRLGMSSPRWSPSTQRVRRSRPCTTRSGSRRLSKSAKFPSLLSTSLELLTHGQCGGTNPASDAATRRRAPRPRTGGGRSGRPRDAGYKCDAQSVVARPDRALSRVSLELCQASLNFATLKRPAAARRDARG